MVTGIQQVYDQRARIVTQMQELVMSATREGRALTPEEDNKFKKMEEDEAGLTRTIEAHEKTEKLAQERAGKHFEQVDAGGNTWNSTSTAKKEDAGYRKAQEQAFESYFRYGFTSLSPEQKQILSESRGTSTQVVGTTTLGGYTVPTGFVPEIIRSMTDYSGIMQACRVKQTDSGNPLPWPSEDDTSTSASLITEGGAFTIQDLTFGQVQLDAYKYGTAAKISYELLQDSAFNMAEELTNTFGPRFGRAMNASGTTGTGSSQPRGVVTGASLGKTAASATDFTFLEVLDLIHSIDPAYRRSTKFGLMFSDSILLAMKKKTIGSSTNDARPLWQPSFAAGQPDTIDGHRYWINQGMSTALTTGQKIALAGDFDKFVVRIVKDMTVQRLDELYAANGLVGFQAHMRWDSEILNSAAIKYLALA